MKQQLTELSSTQSKPKSATFEMQGGRPTIVPGHSGYTIDWAATAVAVAGAVGENRTADVAYIENKPRLTTEAAKKLGIREVVSDYTTGVSPNCPGRTSDGSPPPSTGRSSSRATSSRSTASPVRAARRRAM